MEFLTIDTSRCCKDGLCIKDCPMAVLKPDANTNIPILAKGGEVRCIGCGHCVAICPAQAISLSSVPLSDCVALAEGTTPSREQLTGLLRSRRSIRQFRSAPVSRVALNQLVEITRWAPSAKNIHPLQWLVVDTTDGITELRSLVLDWMRTMVESENGEWAQKMFGGVLAAAAKGDDYLFWKAPAVLVAHANGKIKTAPADASIALTSSELLAATMGLGTCWAGYFQWAANAYAPLQEFLKLPAGNAVLGAVMVGYPAVKYHRIPPRPDADVRWLSDDLAKIADQ